MQWLGILLLTAALLAMAPGYGSAQPAGEKGASPVPEPQVQGTGAPAPSAKSYPLKDRQAYQKKVAADLAKLQERINALHGEYETVRPQMKRMTLRVLHSLKKQLIAAQNQLATLEKASEKDWGGLKAEMDKDMKELTTAYKEAESRLR
jgi:hypothetical protein